MKIPRMVLLNAALLTLGLAIAAASPQPGKPVVAASAPRFHKITVVAVEGKITPDVIRVRRGDLVRLTFLPRDGTYGVSIPVLKLKGKATPDRPVTFEFAASSEGEYEMRCTKTWSVKHWSENGKIVVE